MGLFGPKTHIKLSISDADLYEEKEKKIIREVDKNLLDEKWWEIATPEDVEAEIKKGADVNAVFYSEYGTKTGENPLSFAIQETTNKLTLAEVHSIFENSSKDFVNTREMCINNILVLIKYGANINAICGEALNEICFDGYLDILNILIENGLDVNQNVSYLFTKNDKLIKIAARNGAEKIVKKLLEAGAKDTRSFMEKIKTHLG